jgi:ENTS family enterobactin (siderophore) exporter
MQGSSSVEKQLSIRSGPIFLTLLIGLAITATLGVCRLTAGARGTNQAYAAWNGSYYDFAGFCSWILSLLAEPQFYSCVEAGIGLMLGALFAQWAATHKKSWWGFVLACGSGLWPWVVSSALIGLLPGFFS